MQVPIELKIKYLDRRIQDIQKLKSSLEQDDYSWALKVGHQVKGNAVTFDFPQMAYIGVAIETAARDRNKEEVKKLILKMENVIFSAQQTFIL
jgi:HPt (histidine-containing phosphotransfer) domain-containing protein